MNIGIVARFTRSESGDGRWYVADEFRELMENTDINLIPILSDKNIGDYVTMCDGLIVPGSYTDVIPGYYGQKRHPETKCDDFDILQLDRSVIIPFLNAGKKVIGICAGMQSLNVIFGGTLNQHINGHSGNITHTISLKQDSFLHSLYGKETMTVNSIHHQSLDKVAEGFTVTAVSEDGCIEAIEKNNVLAVQWHPEIMKDCQFFTGFFNS